MAGACASSRRPVPAPCGDVATSVSLRREPVGTACTTSLPSTALPFATGALGPNLHHWHPGCAHHASRGSPPAGLGCGRLAIRGSSPPGDPGLGLRPHWQPPPRHPPPLQPLSTSPFGEKISCFYFLYTIKENNNKLKLFWRITNEYDSQIFFIRGNPSINPPPPK